jgi:cellulose synthase/poly-beta-1,6-N-acetylglucosamine synthase-like glycosyltransferase
LPETRPTLSVVVPVYNEAATIAELIRRVRATPYEKEIVVVDRDQRARLQPWPAGPGATAATGHRPRRTGGR